MSVVSLPEGMKKLLVNISETRFLEGNRDYCRIKKLLIQRRNPHLTGGVKATGYAGPEWEWLIRPIACYFGSAHFGVFRP